MYSLLDWGWSSALKIWGMVLVLGWGPGHLMSGEVVPLLYLFWFRSSLEYLPLFWCLSSALVSAVFEPSLESPSGTDFEAGQ